MFAHLVAVLALACACVVGAADAAPVADPSIAAPAQPTASDLITTGKEALIRYNSDPTMHAGAIVDAAVAFELAHRATTEWTDPAVINDIQASLFWCRKQMDAVAMGQYRARVDALPALKPPALTSRQAGAKPARTVKPAAASAPQQIARPIDPPVLQQWVQRLQDRIRAGITARREPHFNLASMKSKAVIHDLSANGTLTLALDGGEMSYPWRLLTAPDLASIAADLPVGEDQPAHALAAFFHLAAGDEPAGRASLQRAGTLSGEVERAFQLTASR